MKCEILRLDAAALDDRLTCCQGELRVIGQDGPCGNLKLQGSYYALRWPTPRIAEGTAKQAAHDAVFQCDRQRVGMRHVPIVAEFREILLALTKRDFIPLRPEPSPKERRVAQ